MSGIRKNIQPENDTEPDSDPEASNMFVSEVTESKNIRCFVSHLIIYNSHKWQATDGSGCEESRKAVEKCAGFFF